MLAVGAPLVAQDPVPQAAEPLGLEEVRQELGELEAAALEDAAKASIRPQLVAAQEALEQAAKHQGVTAELRGLVGDAPETIASLQAELATLSDASAAVSPELPESIAGQREALESARAELGALEGELAEAEESLAAVRARPVQLAERLPAARSELLQRKPLPRPDGGEGPSARLAEWMKHEAERRALEAEVAMLEEEQRGQGLRERLWVARRDALAARLEQARAGLEFREAAFRQRQSDEVAAIRDRIDELAGKAPEDARVAELVAGLRELAGDYEGSVDQLGDIRRDRREAGATRERLSADLARLRRQFERGGLEAGAAQILFEERRRLPAKQRYNYVIRERQQQLAVLHVKALGTENQLANHGEFAAGFGDDPGDAVAGLLELRRGLLDKLFESERLRVRELAALNAEQGILYNLIEETASFLKSNLFWARTAGPATFQTFRNLPAAARWFFTVEHLRDSAAAIGRSIGRHPFIAALAVLLVAGLALARPRLVAVLKDQARRTRRISTDSYAGTMRALIATVLLALPLPLLVGLAGLGLVRDPEIDGWGRGFGGGLAVAGVILFFLGFFLGVFRRDGLGPHHFRWAERMMRSSRRVLLRVVAIFIPALLVVAASILDTTSQSFESLGRLVLMLALAAIALVFGHGIKRSWKSMNLEVLGALRPLAVIMIGLLVVVPAILVPFAAAGWINTAVSLSLVFLGAVAIAMLGWITYGLVLRWFMIKERRLAVEQVLRDRRARLEAAAGEGEPAGESEMPAIDEDEVQLDLDTIGQQTRRLLSSLATAAILMSIWLFAAGMIPGSSRVSGAAEVPAWVGWFRAGLVIWVGSTVIRNLPGLLELGGLRRAAPDAGTRFAIATIAQYVGFALVALAVMHLVRLDLEQFGWIAAALSVGLGFGLQEVVANFVCGIILLFERPIRVGDVVVIDNISGTVSKIRMRATTITNFDREEYVVPNKNFITGSLINCTLSSRVNRVNLPVGIAYGSDVARALEILREVAVGHPGVMEEPAPFATFEAFGDSSLDLKLRCYLPDRDNRLGVITDLHRAIDERFQQAGIEIPFPQRDLHLRSVDAPGFVAGGGAEPGQDGPGG